MTVTDDDFDERPFWKQRGWLISAAFFSVVLIFAGFTAIGGIPRKVAAPLTVTGPLSDGAAAPGGRPAGCSTDDSDQRIPVRSPKDLVWRPLNGGKVPVSASGGPLRTEGPMLWCFARTPVGAVLAAYVIPRQLSGTEWATVVDQQLVPGSGRDLFAAMRASIKEAPVQYSANSIEGFLVMSYSPDAASVRQLIKFGTAGYAAADYQLSWSNGDWKLLPSSTGDVYGPLTPVANTTGFVLWGN